MSIVAGPLSDNRLQLFVNYGDAIWTTWQQSADPDSGWFPWSPMEATQGVECVATCSLADGSLALFVIGVQGALYGQKLSSDVDADWGYFFSVFETGYGLSIAALVLPWSAPQVAAFVLANDPQITYQGPGQLYQTLKGGSDVSDSFGPATYFVNPGPWFFGRVTLPISPAAGLILAARLPNDQIQLWFNAPMANTADSPIFSTWGERTTQSGRDGNRSNKCRTITMPGNWPLANCLIGDFKCGHFRTPLRHCIPAGKKHQTLMLPGHHGLPSRAHSSLACSRLQLRH